MKFLVFLFSFMILMGCATSKVSCPSPDEEKVSICRAREACFSGGFLARVGFILGGEGASNNYDTCIDRNIKAQKTNAGIKTEETVCVSRRLNGSTKTICENDL